MRRAFYRQHFFILFFLWHIQGYAVTHKDGCLFLGGRVGKKNARLILEIMQILDAFGNKVGGEKNGDGVPQLETKALQAKGTRDCSRGAWRDS